MDFNIVLDVCFSFFIAFYVVMYYKDQLKTYLDKIFGILAIIISFIILFSKSNILIHIGHFLYIIIYLLAVTLFSKNRYILMLNIIMISTILFTKVYYRECIIAKKSNNITLLPAIEKMIIPLFNSPGLYEIMLLISLYNFYLNK